MPLGWIMRVRRVLVILCAALLALAGSAGADEVAPSAMVQPDVAPSAQPLPTTAPVSTTVPDATPAPAATAVPEAAPEVTPAPTPTAAAPEATPVARTTPAPTATAAVEATRAAEVARAATVMAAVAPVAPAASLATRARTMTVAVAAQATPTPAPAPSPPSECAAPVEIMDTGEPTPSVDGVCRVSAAVCSILGTAGDDVLTGSPFDDIICGFGGDDRIDGGDGNDVLLGGDGDDEVVGGDGDDCMVGGPGTDSANNTAGEFPEVEDSAPLDVRSIHGGTTHGATWRIETAEGVTFDADGRCTGAASYKRQRLGLLVSPEVRVPRPQGPGAVPRASAPAAALTVATSVSDGLSLGLPKRRLAVRRGAVRVRVSCSADVIGELVLLAGTRRIAHKRFICTAPDTTVRVRLNDAGRKLTARDDRVQARLLVLAAGRTVSRQVLLVSPDG